MRVLRMGPAEVQRCWPWLSRLLGDMPGILERVLGDQVGLYRIAETEAVIILSVGTVKGGGQRALWIENLTGTVGWRPKDNLKCMGDVFADCAVLAVASGCSEVRITPGTRSDWKTRLLPRFGFEADGKAMRRIVADG